MNRASPKEPRIFGCPRRILLRWVVVLLLAGFLMFVAQSAKADESAWEYKVVILQGVTAGGAIEKDSSGIFVDVGRTRALNSLAASGWEVVAVIGGLATDHSVYLRRRLRN